MTALSVPKAAKWRTAPYQVDTLLYLDRPSIIFAARVNASTFTYPLAQVAFDTVTTGAYTDIKVGYTVFFGSTAGADDLGRTYVRKAPTSTILYFGESSQGDHDGEVDLADNVFMTIIDDRRIWGVPPRFDKDTATAYKFYDLEVDSGGRNYASHPGPKANGGAWRIALIDPITEVATFDFSDESLPVTPGSTISSRVWDVIDGAITVGTSTSSSMTAEFSKGRRYVELTATDSNGHTHTHYILTLALDPDDATWKPITQFEILDRHNTIAGAELTVIIHEDIPATTYYEGVAWLLFEIEYYGGVKGSLTGPATLEQVQGVGWLDTENESPEATLRGIQMGTELRCISAAERLRQINLLPQLMKYKGNPDAWDEMADLTNARVLWYLLRWHSTALELCNLYLSVNGWDSLIKRWATTASNLYDQAVEAAKARAQLFTCDQRGMLHIVQNSLVLSATTGERSNVDIVALTEADVISIDLERNRFPNTYWLDGSAITIGTSTDDIIPMFSRAPGNAPGQGAQRTSFAGLIVDGQEDLNVWTGNEYARINAPWLPARIRLKYSGDAGIDPALGEWITLTLPSTTNRRGRSFTAQRFLPTEVSIQHSNDAVGTKVVELTAVIETSGAPAETISIPKGGGNITIYGTVNTPPLTVPGPAPTGGGTGGYQLYKGVGVMAAFQGQVLLLTADFESVSPSWAVIVTGTTDVFDFVVDAFSPRYLGTGDEVNGWAFTDFNTYRIEDVFDVGSGRTITAQNAALVNQGIAQMDSPFSSSGYVAHVQHVFNDKVQVAHSEDNGATWSLDDVSAFTIGYATPYDLFYCTRVHRIYCGGASATDVGDLYKSDDSGFTWDRVTTFADHLTIQCIHVPWHDNPAAELVYYSTIDASNVHHLYRYQVGGARTDITPIVSGVRHIPTRHWGLTSHVSDRRRMAMIGLNYGAAGSRPLLTTLDGGDTWTVKQVTTPYTHVFIAGDDGNVLYLWGVEGNIGYSQDFGATIQDKTWNLRTDYPSLGEIQRICGG